MSLPGGTLGRYVFRQAAGALLLILISLTTIVWIGVALRQLELMTNQGQDVLRFLAMTALAVPNLLAFVAPLALLIASIHVLNRLGSDSELIVMTAGGAPVWKLIKPLGLLALLVALGVSAVSHLAGPWSQRQLREYTIQVRTDLIGQVIKPWRFTEPEPKLTIHIRDRAPNGDLAGLLLHDARDPKQAASYLAERAQILKQDGIVFLRMENGHIVSRGEGETRPRIISFSQYVIDLNQLEQRPDATQTVRPPRERYTTELLRLAPDDPLRRRNSGRVASDLHERFSSPLYAFTFVLIALAFAGRAQTTRQNRTRSLIAAFGAGALCRMLGIAAQNAVAIRPGSAFLMYLVPVGAGLLAAIATQRQIVPRPSSRLRQRASAILDEVRLRLRNLLAHRLRGSERRWAQGSRMLVTAHTLRRYVAKRFLLGIVGAFLVCACLIYMIDMIELLRISRRARDLSVSTLLWIGLLRLPAFAELLLAFAVLVGSIAALLSLNRRSELTVMRSAGMSVWQFLRPGLVVTFLFGVLAVTLFNPLAASARFEAERLVAEMFGVEAGLLAGKGEGAWLRQDGPDGESVLSARATANQGLNLSGVMAYLFDPKGRFIERIDAERAILHDHYWELQKAVVSRPLREAETFTTYSLSTRLTRESATEALGSEIAVSFWQLPALIEEAEKVKLSATKYRMQYAILLSRPALLIAMVILAATVSLRSFRSGGIQTMVLVGMVGGIGLFLLVEVSRQIGVTGVISPTLAVWAPIAVSLLVSLTVLLHQEDG
jgi:lipopolysaccharide export system permease protein